MMEATTISNADLIPALTPDEVREIANVELAACTAVLQRLSERDWTTPTDCAGWTVHDLTAHLVGQYQGLANPWTYLRRHYQAHRRYPTLSRLDADNRIQIDELRGRSGAELVALLSAVGGKAIRTRHSAPNLVRRMHVGRMYPEEPLPDDRLSYIFDALALRDPWMHRVDLSRATGQALTLDDHDHLIVAQVVADLARAWSDVPVVLDLTGPAGGRWTLGRGVPVATVRSDAVDYMRALSGRADANLEVEGDPAASTAVASARVVF